ncbi:MAG: metalloprotease [Halobacteriales archaeon SW_9_67_25]|nr:MAG: metalloprotease [Halobacteriales archaeon SW_9_67_25]
MSTHAHRQQSTITFSRRELRDLAAAWVALGVAFTIFLAPGTLSGVLAGAVGTGAVARLFALSMLTVGTGFLLHELAHKLVAVRFGQVAAFRADYSMLGLTVLVAMAGFLFAAPGAVYHRGRITARENGLIALAGPVTNVGLAALFVPLSVAPGFPGAIGTMGIFINVLLAAFNMIPFGPLDGRKVLAWNRAVFAAVAAPTVAVALALLFGLVPVDVF